MAEQVEGLRNSPRFVQNALQACTTVRVELASNPNEDVREVVGRAQPRPLGADDP